MNLNLDKSRWTRVKFGEVVFNVNSTVKDAEAAGLDRVIAMEHLDPGELRIQRWGNVGDGTTFTRRVKPGQTLFGKRRAYQRKVAYAEFDAICSGDILTFQANEAQMLPEFLPFLVQSDGFFAHALGTSAGSLSPRTNWTDLSNFEFDLPPLDEQKRLADLLWTMDAHRGAEERKSHLLSEVINRYCVEVYEHSLQRFPSTAFDQVGELLMGRQKAPKYMTGIGSKPYLRVANVGVLQLSLGEVEKMDFSEREIARFRLLPGDVLLTEGDIVSAMNVGRPAIYNGELLECAFQNTLIRFRPHKGADSGYYLALFEGMRLSGVFAGAASTTTVTHLGLGRLSAVPLPAAPITYQKVIGDSLRELLNARESSNAAQTALSALRTTTSVDIFGGPQ